ncbi:hypothetical protein BSR29_07410 [Boudabousia liubingyangii]|uniref:DUF5671 domain-containing protein n=1 Tax=Boudabousia liubingyangii TaxID=1921764 RepID=A0A1Q5PK97_9ACTO|nr:hypothetical protein [Boudabousia liubingyangii]OKL46638.1 hypothetical protein BSR29_07410 [Boudabousia liubingyangii]
MSESTLGAIFDTIGSLGLAFPIVIFLAWLGIHRVIRGAMPISYQVRSATAALIAPYAVVIGAALMLMGQTMVGMDLETGDMDPNSWWMAITVLPMGIACYLIADLLLFETLYRNHTAGLKRGANLETPKWGRFVPAPVRVLLGLSVLVVLGSLYWAWDASRGTKAAHVVTISVITAAVALLISLGTYVFAQRNISLRPALLSLNEKGDEAARWSSSTRITFWTIAFLWGSAALVFQTAIIQGLGEASRLKLAVQILGFGAPVVAFLTWMLFRSVRGGTIWPTSADLAEIDDEQTRRAAESERSVFSLLARGEAAGPVASVDYGRASEDELDEWDRRDD